MAWVGVITNVGASLLAQWTSGTTLTIASAKGGTGTVSQNVLMNQTTLVNERQTLSLVSGADLPTGRKIKIQAPAPQTGYTLNQIGIYAHIGSGADVLLALYQNEAGVTIPSATESPEFVYTFFGTLNASNTGELDITVDASAIVTAGSMDSSIGLASASLGGASAYSATTAYTAGQYCTYQNKTWRCLTSATGQTPAEGTYWTAVSLSGLDAKAPVKSTATMLAASWSGSTYSFESAFPSATYDIEIEIAPTATQAQYKAYGKAMLAGSASANTVTAIGTVPTVDIPIIITERRK